MAFGGITITGLPKLPSTQGNDCYLARFSTSSNTWVWAKMFGGNGNDQCNVFMSVLVFLCLLDLEIRHF